MNTVLLWFKTDLRLHDNETLVKAIAHSDNVIPVYCFDERHYQPTEFGFSKTGAIRAQFILEALTDLDKNLRQLGSGLIVVKGNTADELRKLAIKYEASAVYCKTEVASEEAALQREVEEKMKPMNCSLKMVNTSTLYREGDLPFSMMETPDMFTAFRRKVEASARVGAAVSVPASVPSPQLPFLKLPSLADLNLNEVKIDDRAASKFVGGESHAMERVHYYFEQSKLVSTYKLTRNGLVGADYSTKFSPWLSVGCLSPRSIVDSLKQYEELYGANESTYWVFFELLWREYFWLMMAKHGKKFFLKNGIRGKQDHTGMHNNEALMQWVNGKTGIDFVDANMQELKWTGFMSNRGRQVVASYLCNDLKLDWRYGAAYFEEQLIDYDVCSNWCNWAYIAGVGNDPRTDRYFNIKKQADQYDADKKYRMLWLDSR